MRKLVLLVTVLLTLTGLALSFEESLGVSPDWRKWLALAHIWAGLLYLVIFALYAWDHISLNRHWLRVFSAVTVTGVLQTGTAAVIILSGVVLMLYGEVAWPTLLAFHYWLTYVLAASILTHYLSPK